MSTRSDHRTLVDKLLSLSSERKLDWKLDIDGDPFCVLAENSITITEGRGGNGAKLMRLTIKNANNEEIDSLNDEDLDDDPGGNYYLMMSALHNSALRKARGSDAALVNILRKLDEL